MLVCSDERTHHLLVGFIGSKVGELLIQNGNHVVGVDNFNSSYDMQLKEWRLSQLQGTPNFIFRRGVAYWNRANR